MPVATVKKGTRKSFRPTRWKVVSKISASKASATDAARAVRLVICVSVGSSVSAVNLLALAVPWQVNYDVNIP